MLVLTRKKHETIHVGEDIVITVVSDGNVRLGINAPPNLRILRGELVDVADKLVPPKDSGPI